MNDRSTVTTTREAPRESRKAKVRVGFDARWYNDSGVGTYVVELLRALIQLQTDLALVVYEDPKNPLPGLDANSIERISLRAGKYSLANQFELRRRISEDRLDIFHSPFYPIPLWSSCPIVVTIHDLIPFLFPLGSGPKQFMVKRGYRIAARRAAHIIAVSNHTAADLQKILKAPAEKITAIHNAVSSDFHPNAAPNEIDDLKQRGIRPPYVVAASARNWRTKNLQAALQALALAQKNAALDFQTVVYGPSEGLEAARESSRELKVVPTGYLSAQELGALFRHAELFIMPSLYEGFGLPILEAMSCGCAVMTSTGGSLPEVAGNGAQVFAPSDVKGMAEAVARLLRNPSELRLWRERALQRAADFSWQRAARETISVYHRGYGKTGAATQT